MANVIPDKLQIARAKFLDQIGSKEIEIRILREKLALLDEVEELAKWIDVDLPASSPKYTGVKLTKAVLDAMRTIGLNGGVSATDVRKYVAANGYKHPNPQNFPIATVIALNRLSKQGQIISEKTEDGKRRFKAKK